MQDILARVAIFDGLPPEGLARLAQLGRPQTFPLGSHLTVQGQMANRMYVVTKGRVRVERTHPQFIEPVWLGEVGPGGIVGHEGLLAGKSHSATATALETTEAIELEGAALSVTVLSFPKVTGLLLRALSGCLRAANDLTEPTSRPDAPSRNSELDRISQQ